MKMTRLWTLLLLCAAVPVAVGNTGAVGGDALHSRQSALATSVAMDPPDFKAIKDPTERKQAFINYLRPSYEVVAANILTQRSKLEKLKAQLAHGIQLSSEQEAWLADMGLQYRLENLPLDVEGIDQLLVRVDILPPELVLSQAATESGWGTSRMARKLNNFFGHYCFEKGCGVTPYRRNGSGEVKAFESPVMAVQAYMRNVNTHPAYGQVRKMRANMRAEVKPLDAVALAGGFNRYSTLGDGYVRKIQGMIRTNQRYWSAAKAN